MKADFEAQFGGDGNAFYPESMQLAELHLVLERYAREAGISLDTVRHTRFDVLSMHARKLVMRLEADLLALKDTRTERAEAAASVEVPDGLPAAFWDALGYRLSDWASWSGRHHLGAVDGLLSAASDRCLCRVRTRSITTVTQHYHESTWVCPHQASPTGDTHTSVHLTYLANADQLRSQAGPLADLADRQQRVERAEARVRAVIEAMKLDPTCRGQGWDLERLLGDQP